MKKWALVVLGAILVAIGAVWIFQGVGVIEGSFMTGQKLWFLLGLLAAVLGLTSLGFGLRHSRRRELSNDE